MGLKTPKQKARIFQMRRQKWKYIDHQETTRSCGKIRYSTELDAKIALASTRRARRGAVSAKEECRYYLCPQCHGYHLTSKGPRNNREIRKQQHTVTPAPEPAKLKGVTAFIENIQDEWMYTIPELDAHGTSQSLEKAKETVRTIARIVAPDVRISFKYSSDEQDLGMFYALQVAGSQNVTTAEKSSYMEPLLSQLRSCLFRNGFRFRKYDDRYPGPPDIVLPKYRLMIFVDPCLWHDRSECKRKALPPETLRIWQNEHAIQWKEALRGRQELADEGWIVLSYWECRFCDNRKREKRLRSFLSDVRHVTRLSRQ
ncbi:hypothetical protein [Bifidobacterium biavatii]|uniref:XorII very-short-patch-repair endonuclease n=1 Tax=Bifidobacterium biavatii DSM 23969 TaxID=1437608 RepID=A0A086ZU58_9BIFI|nr:hypothetical protein [Bifidobacterium biavatii]KFI50058.1 XorII very-short-patch-repair endonuclease [Bifidobacterium biavatii DSM 23969]